MKRSADKLLKKSKKLRQLSSQLEADHDDLKSCRLDYNEARIQHRKLVRYFKAKDSFNRDQSLLADPAATYKNIRFSSRQRVNKIQKLNVGPKAYFGKSVSDGFFDSIAELKSRDSESLSNSKYFMNSPLTLQIFLRSAKKVLQYRQFPRRNLLNCCKG